MTPVHPKEEAKRMTRQASGTATARPLWNFQCHNCWAKYRVRRIELPLKGREKATCKHCAFDLPPRDGKDLLQYELVERPQKAPLSA